MLSFLHEWTSTLPDWKPSEGSAELWLLLWPVLAGCVNCIHTTSRVVCPSNGVLSQVAPAHNRSHRCTLIDVMAYARLDIQQQDLFLAQVKDTENRGQREIPDAISSLYASGRCRDELREEKGNSRGAYGLLWGWRNKRPVNSIIVGHSNSHVMDQLNGPGEEGVWKEAF